MRGARRSRRRHPNPAPSHTPSCPPPLRHSRAPTREPMSPAHQSLTAAAWPPPHRGGLRRGPPAPRRHAPSATTPAPPPNAPPTPTMLVGPCPEPVGACRSLSKGGRLKPHALAPGRPARFTSKCRKMSQNVALFHTPTRRMSHFTSKKPHVFGRNPAILAHFRSFSLSGPPRPMPSSRASCWPYVRRPDRRQWRTAGQSPARGAPTGTEAGVAFSKRLLEDSS